MAEVGNPGRILARLANQANVPGAGVALEYLGRAVLRPVVGRDDEVGAGIEVEREPRVDDVDLVRARSVMTSVIAGPVYELRGSGLDRALRVCPRAFRRAPRPG